MTAPDVVRRDGEGLDEVTVVDCDIHLTPRDAEALLVHAPRDAAERLRGRLYSAGRQAYVPYWSASRRDSVGADGAPAGSDPDLVWEQLFQDAGVDVAVVLPLLRMTVDPLLNHELSAATNRWLEATWLDVYGPDRLYGSINVAIEEPGAGAAEIERWGGDRRFRQVLIGHHTGRPLGDRMFDPVWEAAQSSGLPVAMHFTSHGNDRLGSTPAGWFQHYVDYHALSSPLIYATHLAGIICGGVLDRFPGLRFVFVEGGFLWHAPLVRRLENLWDAGLGDELRGLQRRPTEYLRDHVRFTSQPIEEAPRAADAAELFREARAAELLMFSSDYPHYDFDHPRRAIPRGLDEDERAAIVHANARALYDIPTVVPGSARQERAS